MTDRSIFDSQPDDAAGGSHELNGRFACTRRFVDLTHTLEAQSESVQPYSLAEAADDESDSDVEDAIAHPEIIELIESLLIADPTLQPAGESRECQRLHSVFVPEHYEAGYAYPLIVWFHGDGGSEADLSNVMPLISERNYIGVALRGDMVSGTGFSWSPAGAESTELVDDVRAIVTSLRREYHVHSERIYLAGFGSGATTAVRLMLKKPEWFGGVTSFSGQFPTSELPLLRCPDLQSKRILLATSLESTTTRVGDVVAAGRLLYSAGIQVGTRVYQDAANTPSRKMLRDLDAWLMDDICDCLKV